MDTLIYKFLIIVLLSINVNVFGQVSDYKQKGLNEGKNRNFPLAISYLKQALEKNPNDPEIYFYLGRYSHYIVYDSRPFLGKGDEWSKNEVIKNLEKAIDLKPDYGYAYYFLGAEYGARALEALKKGDIQQFKNELINGKKSGGYPDWMLEYGRNLLKSCEKDAILFLFGDLELNAVLYIQIVEEYRKDVLPIPPFLLARPWYARLLKEGVPGVWDKAPISWTEIHISDMHPYQWSNQIVEIPVSDSYMKIYNIPTQNNIMKWELKPDLGKNLLNTGTALLSNIIETNKWARPVYFAFGPPGSIYDLNDYFQITGIANKLLPFKTVNTEFIYDLSSTEKVLLNHSSYKYFPDLAIHDLSYATDFFPYNYRKLLFDLAQYYYSKRNYQKALSIIEKMEGFMPESIYPMPEQLLQEINRLKDTLSDQK
jgi:tetratricopeptide (TPR) repeat protein